MIDPTNINYAIGTLILILNLIPFFTNKKYYGITLPLSALIAVIRILFM